jgi:tetratricopeptide (TPR) repeat protein
VTSYDSCLARVDEDPKEAYDAALNWQDFGAGGAAAKHCAALALVADGQYEEAARQLEALAAEPGAGGSEARAEILAQAGNAWLLQGKPTLAYNALSRALALKPASSRLLVDRGRALMLFGRYGEAESDLTDVIEADPRATDARVLRARARHAMGDLKGARQDADEAVKREPANAEALLERGLILEAQGDLQSALADWRAALGADGQSVAGREAQRLLQRAAIGETGRSSEVPPTNRASP